MRIAIGTPYYWPEVTRGAERYVADLAAYLVQRGHSVDVLVGTSGTSGSTVEDGVLVRRLHHVLPERLARRGITAVDTFGATVFPVLLRRRYDVVHMTAPTAAVAARLTAQRVVFTILGHPTDEQLDARPHYRHIFSAGVRAGHITTAYSRASAAAAEAIFQRPVEPVHLGVRVDRFPLRDEPRTGPPRILFPAWSAERRKGLHHLLRAMPAILDRHVDARVHLLGGGDTAWAFREVPATDRQRVRAAVDDLGRHVGDLGAFYRRATVSVLPSWNEAFGVVLVESLASGTPAVCNSDGGMPEIVSDPAVGRVTQSSDPAALTEAVLETIELARDAATPSRCAARARRWDWESAIGPQHEALYARAARGR